MRGPETQYDILGISPDATLKEIRHAYHKGALRYHPDNRHRDPAKAEAMFRKLAKAYKKALRSHLPKCDRNNSNTPYSPADLARMNTSWHSDQARGRYVPGGVCQQAMQSTETARSVATVDENKVFVLIWAVVTIMGIAFVLSSGSLGIFGNLEGGVELSHILAVEMMALFIITAILGGSVYGLILTRKTIWLTLQWGVRLLPFLPNALRPKQLPQSPSQRR
jgi:hypothetical protein